MQKLLDSVMKWLRDDKRWVGLVLFAVALAVRLVFLGSLSGTLYWDLLTNDSHTYYAQAEAIAAGTFESPEGFFMTPLYPLFLAVFRLVGLEPLLWARVVQMVLGALTALFVYRLAFEATGKRWAGLIGGGLLAVLGPALFHDGMLLVTNIAAFVLTLGTLELVRFAKDRRTRSLVGAGVCLGLGGLAWGTILAVVPALLVWLIVVLRKESWRKALGRAGILAGCVLLPILPVTVYNAAQSGEFILTTANLGINLQIGNHPGGEGLFSPPVQYKTGEVYEATGRLFLSRVTGHYVTLAEANRYWLRQALRYISDHPGEFAVNLLRKAWYFVHGYEWPQLESYGHYTEVVPWLGLPWPTLAVVMPLALLGLGLAWPRRRELAPVYLVALFYAAAVVLFFITGRYRFPVVPLVCAFAGIAVWRLVEFVREKKWRTLGLSAGVLAVLAVGTNIPDGNIEKLSDRGVAYYNMASRLLGAERYAEAADYFGRAETAFAETPPSLYLDWGVTLHRLGRLDEALEKYLRAEELGEDSPKLPMDLGTVYTALGRYPEAEEAYLWAMRVAPDWRDAYLGASESAAAQGRPLDGAGYLDRGLERLGFDPVLMTRRGDLKLAGGDLYGARADYEAVLADRAGFAPAVLGLGRTLLALGDAEGARSRFEEVLALAPGGPKEAGALRPLREQARELLRRM
ncbi:MAG: tetratricopeptide repeat protein [bacterium]|nr:tetratricopeptide repeat protein [bacterium]